MSLSQALAAADVAVEAEDQKVIVRHDGTEQELGPFGSGLDALLASRILAAKAAGVAQGPAAAASFGALADALQACAAGKPGLLCDNYNGTGQPCWAGDH
ncbi:hypothetical protein ABPG75_010914 [Micractinium tetrahymenae]